MTTKDSGRLFSKQEIVHFFQQLKSCGKTIRQAHAIIAYYGWRLKAGESWTDLGFEDEEAMRKATEIPQSTYYKYLKLGSGLRHLTLEQLQAIPPQNLEYLGSVSIALWPEHDWVTEASTLPPEELCELICKRNREIGDAREPMTRYNVSVPASSQKMIETAVKSFQERHNLASPGRALELLIADKFDRPSYMGALIWMRHRLLEFKAFLETEGIIEGDGGKPEINPAAYKLLEDIRTEFGEVYAQALATARTAASRKDQGRRRGAAAESSGQDGADEAEVGGMEGAEVDLPLVHVSDAVERQPGV